MNMSEYLAVKDFTYLEYCDYLQGKYGIGLTDYMTKSYYKNPKCTRTKDGLTAHHKKEDTMILLSRKEVAMECPFEWQSKENIVYCDYLEHLLLHALICEYPEDDFMKYSILDSLISKYKSFARYADGRVGYEGLVNFIVPELNDLYSGWETAQVWRKNCHDKVKDDKTVYLAILKRFIENEKKNENFDVAVLCKSFNGPFGYWSDEKNSKLYEEIMALV